MKYALESLPEILGEQQFKDLCTAMGVEPSETTPTGDEFATMVRERVISQHRISERLRERLHQVGLA